jgi:aspartate 1-decarboxylase
VPFRRNYRAASVEKWAEQGHIEVFEGATRLALDRLVASIHSSHRENRPVQRFMLKSKIHRATLTGTELHYEGSITIDKALLEAANMFPGEQVQVVNVSNGSRLITYIIEAEAGTGTILLNGPAARLGVPGDLVIILTYCTLTDEEIASHKPILVHVDENNRIR